MARPPTVTGLPELVPVKLPGLDVPVKTLTGAPPLKFGVKVVDAL